MTKETYTRWKLEEYVKTGDDIRGLLEAAAEEDQGDGIVIRSVLQAIVQSGNLSALAREAGLDRGNLYTALSENGNPSLTTICKVAQALGLRLRLEPIESNPVDAPQSPT